ncbi:MAG: hypothetical protein OQK98_10620 [Gammaproteobacteria bacterium]|nr:hypothetical protein [Gammaproteobacteria bacterium]
MKQDKVVEFLRNFKHATSERGVFIIPRDSTLLTLKQLGMTKRNLQDELLALSLTNYSKGPERDRDQVGELWIFGKVIARHEMYIKLKIFNVDSEYHAKCISFHVAKYPLLYPFSEK